VALPGYEGTVEGAPASIKNHPARKQLDIFTVITITYSSFFHQVIKHNNQECTVQKQTLANDTAK